MRLLLAPVLVLLALVVAVVAVQVVHRLTPAPLSEDAKALARELKQLPRQNDNGDRLAGLLAPEALERVPYGRCVTEAKNASARFTRAMQEAVRSPASSIAVRDEGGVRALPCGQITHDWLFAPGPAVNRNPVERLLLVIGTPAHTNLGPRMRDLRNAAPGLRAALRLREGAPESDVPRDLYSARPFERSAEGKHLRVTLRRDGHTFGKRQPLEFPIAP